MQRHATLRLFRRGPAAEVKLALMVLVAFALLVSGTNWKTLNPFRQAIAVFLYPFQRAVMLPRDAIVMVGDWFNAAAEIRAEAAERSPARRLNDPPIYPSRPV